MTYRLIVGVDPGHSGAIALLADGVPAGFIDMPLVPRETKGFKVNAKALCAHLRGIVQQYQGAYILGAIERVNAMPSFSRDGGERRSMGSQSSFDFGHSLGVIECALTAAGITYCMPTPMRWKKEHGLLGHPKDASRLLAIDHFPMVAEELKRKKDGGRADALLIAEWAVKTEQIPKAA